jgi:nitrogen fixation protein NifU and related proteins
MSFDMYREIILDHYQHPRNFGVIKSPDGQAEKNNPLCGDRITISYKLDAKKKIKDIKFSGAGCSVSKAAASILTETVKGKNIADIGRYTDNDFMKDMEAPIAPARRKCALLALETLRQAVADKKRTGKK